MSHFTILNDFPCSSCGADCCGPVPISHQRLGLIEGHLKTLGAERVKELKRQKRGKTTCHFLDTKTRTCAIYPVRPTLCRLYGTVEKMCCPKVGHLVKPVHPAIADMEMGQEYKSGIAMLSTEFVYPEFL